MELKLLMLMYLEEDEACVDGLLAQHDVATFSRLSMEGQTHATSSGWYGVAQPYRSRLILALLPSAESDALLAAVSECRGVQDPRHPIRAMQLAVERSASCECDPRKEENEAPQRAADRDSGSVEPDA